MRSMGYGNQLPVEWRCNRTPTVSGECSEPGPRELANAASLSDLRPERWLLRLTSCLLLRAPLPHAGLPAAVRLSFYCLASPHSRAESYRAAAEKWACDIQ